MYEHLALSDNGFLFDTRTGTTLTLNRTGTFLLRALIAGAEPEMLPAQLVGRFEVDPDTAARDVEQFMFRLKDLQVAGAADGDR